MKRWGFLFFFLMSLALMISCAGPLQSLKSDSGSHNNLGRYSKAINAFKKAIRINPDDAEAHNNLGGIYGRLGKYSEAMDEFKEAIRINPDDAKAHNDLGVTYDRLGKYSEAMDEFKEAIRINPDDAKAHNNLGSIYGRHGKYSEAMDEFKEAIRINPDYAEAHSNLGIIYGKHGKYSEAMDEYKEAIRTNPDYAKAHNNLGVIYGKHGKYSEAMDEFKEAIRINPDYAEAHSNLGVIYGKHGKYSEAMDEFKEAIRINPDYAKAHLALESIYEKFGIDKETKLSETKRKVTTVSAPTNVDIVPVKIKNYKRKNSYAVVIGISNYREEIIPSVKYAKSDAKTVAKYLENIGGVPRRNIKLLTDNRAGFTDLTSYLEEWLPRRVKKDSEVFIYYAGHGAPDPDYPKSREAYIVPYEGHPDFKSKLYPLKRMYESLNKLPSKQVVVVLDSCFSGAGERSVVREGARPINLSIENPVLAGGKIAVLAASTGNQISSDYDRVKHGLFTYYLLKGMRGDADSDNNGIVQLEELYEYIKENVSETASIELNRDQTPVLLPDLKQNRHGKIEITRVR